MQIQQVKMCSPGHYRGREQRTDPSHNSDSDSEAEDEVHEQFFFKTSPIASRDLDDGFAPLPDLRRIVTLPVVFDSSQRLKSCHGRN
jgi:hypothetical protein